MKRSRATTALVSALITLIALALLCAIWSPSGAQGQPSTDPWEGSAFTRPVDSSPDGVFAGIVKHTPPTPTASVELDVKFSSTDSHPSACTAPGPQPPQTYWLTTPTTPTTPTTTPTSPDPSSTPPTEPPPQSSSVADFSIHVPFICNGLYDATAALKLDAQDPAPGTIKVTSVKVAIPPPAPASFVATDNGNRTVRLTWTPPTSYSGAPGPPPDFLGYRVSRRDIAAASFTELGTPPPDVLTFDDASIPFSGGSYVYQIETRRTFANSDPKVTSNALVVAGASSGGGGGGGSVSGSPSRGGSGGTGVQHFDEETLPADEGELGAGDPLAGVPGGETIQRFAGRAGAGLITPFAAALDLAVWAGLLLFLTRRAASAERVAALTVELEHLS